MGFHVNSSSMASRSAARARDDACPHAVAPPALRSFASRYPDQPCGLLVSGTRRQLQAWLRAVRHGPHATIVVRSAVEIVDRATIQQARSPAAGFLGRPVIQAELSWRGHGYRCLATTQYDPMTRVNSLVGIAHDEQVIPIPGDHAPDQPPRLGYHVLCFIDNHRGERSLRAKDGDRVDARTVLLQKRSWPADSNPAPP